MESFTEYQKNNMNVFTFLPLMNRFLSQVRLLTLRILSQFEAELPPQTEVRLSVQILIKLEQIKKNDKLGHLFVWVCAPLSRVRRMWRCSRCSQFACRLSWCWLRYRTTERSCFTSGSWDTTWYSTLCRRGRPPPSSRYRGSTPGFWDHDIDHWFLMYCLKQQSFALVEPPYFLQICIFSVLEDSVINETPDCCTVFYSS